VSAVADSPARPAGAAAARGGWIHFGVAAGVLLVAAVGFHVAKDQLKIHLVKAAVPWPEGTEVDEHRLVSFPATIGPYVLAGDGGPDGIAIMTHDQLKELGTLKHDLNWYYSATYRDTRARSADDPARFIQLDITYYTGLLDAAPHVPDICLRAAGFTPISSRSGEMAVAVPGADKPWDKFPVRRTVYALRAADGSKRRSAQYYVFSMNGGPTASRGKIRLELMLPWRKYCYFAKIQIATMRSQPSLDASDAVCKEFLQHALPAALKFLPSAEAVRTLEERDG